jgi:photosystem II stability/assembly factor-like uncharacterized protein
MKTRKILLFLLMLSGMLSNICATQYLGLGYEPGQGFDKRKAQIIDGYMYVPTSKGLFRKSVTTLNDTIWELYAFKDVSIKGFVKKNDSIVAITTNTTDNFILLSTDDGKTYRDYNSDYFKDTSAMGMTGSLNIIKSNPLNENSLLLGYYGGLLKSTDFGKTWTKLSNSMGVSYYIGYNFTDATIIYCAGTSAFSSPFIYVSNDEGKTWNMKDIRLPEPQGCFVIYPSKKYSNLIFAGFGLWIYLSRDKGQTWLKGDKTEIGAVTCFAENSSYYYASGKSYDGKLRVYWSGEGEFWWPYNFQPINGVSNGYDIHVVGNDVLLFTERGVFNISAQSTSLSETALDVSVVQNGTTVCFKGTEIIESVRIHDITGKLIEEFHPDDNNYTIDVSSYRKGLYLFEFGNKNNVLKKKIVFR